MKIGLVLDDSLDKPDGVQQYVTTVGAWLAANGHEVHYLVGETVRSDLPNIHSLSKNIKVRFNKNRASIPFRADKRAIRELLAAGFDVLHIQMPFSPVMSGYIIRTANKDTVIFGTFHIFPFSTFQKLANRLLSLCQRFSLKRFDDFVSVSKPAQQFAEISTGRTSRVIPNAIDLTKFRVDKPHSDKAQIVFLGRLVERKGALELLQAVHQLNAQGALDNAQVRIGGKGPLEKELRAFCKAHRLEEVVSFDGYIAEKDKAGYLAAAEIAVFPSLGGESFGIVLLEAMAAGAGVVLAGDNPGYRSVIKDKEMLINPPDTTAFAEKLRHLLKNKSLRKELGAKQKTLVKSYDIEKIGPQITKLYSLALHGKRSVR